VEHEIVKRWMLINADRPSQHIKQRLPAHSDAKSLLQAIDSGSRGGILASRRSGGW
jgi:hypothetical protein